jgi:hypothetical protein
VGGPVVRRYSPDASQRAFGGAATVVVTVLAMLMVVGLWFVLPLTRRGERRNPDADSSGLRWSPTLPSSADCAGLSGADAIQVVMGEWIVRRMATCW